MLSSAETEFIQLLKIDPYLLREFIRLFSKKTMLEYMEKKKFKPYIEFIPRNFPRLLKKSSNNVNFEISSAWIHESELKNRETEAGYKFHDASNMNLQKARWVYNNYNSHYILAHELVALFQEKNSSTNKINVLRNLSYDNLYHTFKKSKSLNISQIVEKLTIKHEDFFANCVYFKL